MNDGRRFESPLPRFQRLIDAEDGYSHFICPINRGRGIIFEKQIGGQTDQNAGQNLSKDFRGHLTDQPRADLGADDPSYAQKQACPVIYMSQLCGQSERKARLQNGQ